MGKLRADEQEPHRRPARRVEVAQHTEDLWYGREGKCGGSAVEQRVITWGDLLVLASVNSGSARNRKVGTGAAEVSRGHSSRGNEPECKCTAKLPEVSPDEGPNR